MHRFVLIITFISLIHADVFSQPKWFRLTYRSDPSTSISIGWSGTSGTLYYDTINHGTNYAQYAMSSMVDRNVTHRGNDHRFVRLTNFSQARSIIFWYNTMSVQRLMSFHS